MIHGRLYRADDEHCLITHARHANTAFERMRGLLGSQKLDVNAGLLISPCACMHTIGMHYPIDVVWLNKTWEIVKIVSQLAPWRFSACFGASMLLELSAGKANGLQLRPGTQLQWQDAQTP